MDLEFFALIRKLYLHILIFTLCVSSCLCVVGVEGGRREKSEEGGRRKRGRQRNGEGAGYDGEKGEKLKMDGEVKVYLLDKLICLNRVQ